jgi:hypothetical protein
MNLIFFHLKLSLTLNSLSKFHLYIFTIFEAYHNSHLYSHVIVFRLYRNEKKSLRIYCSVGSHMFWTDLRFFAKISTVIPPIKNAQKISAFTWSTMIPLCTRVENNV